MKSVRAIGVCLGIFISGCINAPNHPITPTVALDLRDYDVLTHVALDFSSNPDCNYGSGDSGLIINAWSTRVTDRPPIGELVIGLDGYDQSNDESLTASIRARNPEEYVIPWRFSGSNQLRVENLEKLKGRQLDQEMASTRCYAAFALPGFSSDGNWAVVKLSVGPSPHGANAWYLLHLHDASWEIVGYQFNHFL